MQEVEVYQNIDAAALQIEGWLKKGWKVVEIASESSPPNKVIVVYEKRGDHDTSEE